MADILDLWNLTEQRIDDNLDNYSMNLVGEDGSGKTSLMYAIRRRMGSTVIWGYEDRFKGVPNVRVVEMKSWDDHIAYAKALKQGVKKGKELPFKNIIMDTVGEAYVMCQNYVMEENDWETMSGERGARYPVVGKAFMDSVRELKHLGCIVNFVSHDKVVMKDDSIDKINPDTANQIKHLVMGGIDIIAYLEKVVVEDDEGNHKEIRRLWFRGNPYYKLKVPLYGFPEYIEYESVDEGADKFIAAFNKAVKVTQKMADEGKDISTPNAENDRIVELEEPKTAPIEDDEEDDFDSFDDEDFEDEEDEKLDTPSIDELQTEVEKIRDKMVKELDGDKAKVARALRKKLGTAKVRECQDADKLNDFIQEYK